MRCQNCGELVAAKGLGRKPLDIGVINVCDALEDSFTVTEASGKLGCSRGYIYKILNQSGISPKGLTKGGHSVKHRDEKS